MISSLYSVSLSLYGLASLVYIAHLLKHSDGLRLAGRIALGLALGAHVATIGSLCSNGLHPLLNASGLFSLTALLLGGGYMAATFRWRLLTAGAVVGPLCLGLMVISRVTLAVGPPNVVAEARLLGRLHMSLVAVGVAAFGLAAAVSVLYLRQDAALRRGKIGGLARGPAITTLDDLGRWLIYLGFPVFTLAVVTGMLWLSRLPDRGGFRLEHVISLVIWGIFAALIVARVTVGLRGRRAALLTVVGFVATGVVIALYVMRRALGQ